MSDWVHAIDGRGQRVLSADSPVSFISNLLNAMSQGGPSILHGHTGAVHLSLNNSSGWSPHPPFDPSFRRKVQRTRDNHIYRSGREDPQSAVTFIKGSTSQRWQEGARILYGAGAMEKSQRVINSILKIMVPPAIELAKKLKAEKDAEIARRAKEAQERQEQKEREEREAREAKEREECERQEREAAEAERSGPALGRAE